MKINLYKQIEKRFQTSMIGSLARVEEYFGFLWGHNKNYLSNKEHANRELWEELRTEILNHCNYQMREALEDIKEYLDYLDKQDKHYEYNFIINKNKENK
jgi:hypothetical protein